MALTTTAMPPPQVVHVGDDRRNDCWGARDAGITAWLWGYDVRSWEQVAQRVLHGAEVRGPGAGGAGGGEGGGGGSKGKGVLSTYLGCRRKWGRGGRF